MPIEELITIKLLRTKIACYGTTFHIGNKKSKYTTYTIIFTYIKNKMMKSNNITPLHCTRVDKQKKKRKNKWKNLRVGWGVILAGNSNLKNFITLNR